MKNLSLIFTAVFLLQSLFFCQEALSQNASYNANTIPILGTNNSAFGFQSLFSTGASSNNNSALGYQALYSNTNGRGNCALGYFALRANTTSSNNVAIGTQALEINTGSSNTAIGRMSLNQNSLGGFNTAVGNNALNNNNIGQQNTALGTSALSSNVTGLLNTGLGAGADVLTGSLFNATAIGAGAIVNISNAIQLGNSSVTQVFAGTGTSATLIAGGLQITGGTPSIGKVLTSDASGNASWQTPTAGGSGWSITGNSGTVDGINFIGTTDNIPFNIRVNNLKAGRIDLLNNTFYGIEAGKNNTSAFMNTAVGYQALFTNTGGSENVAIGYQSLYNNNTPSNIGGGTNVALGNYSLYSNTNGLGNSAVGHNALYSTTTGVRNSATGSLALFSNTSGDDNTAIGNNALRSNVSGKNNTGLGQFSDLSFGTVINNSTALGSGTIVNASNKVRLGNATVTVVEGPVVYTVSDGRFKKNISETDIKGLEFIKKLRPVVYNFDTKKFQEFLTQNMPDSLRKLQLSNLDFASATAIRQSGFIAQEVEKAAKETGYNFNGVHVPESANDNYSLAYGEFVVPLVKAVQELNKQNEELRKEMEELKALVSANSKGTIKIDGGGVSAELFQNAPNPFNKSTTIKYSIPEAAKKAIITIFSSNGVKVKEYNLAVKQNSMNISGGQLSAGTYIYSLYIDDILIDSKQMILTR